MGEVWIAALATTVVGAGVSMYGANKQSKDAAHAQDLSLQAQADAQRTNWNTYLSTRGIAPGNAAVGEIPGYAPGSAVNTRLPLWAKVVPPTRPQQVAPPVGADGQPMPFLVQK